MNLQEPFDCTGFNLLYISGFKQAEGFYKAVFISVFHCAFPKKNSMQILSQPGLRE